MKKARKYRLSACVYSRLEGGPEKEDGFSVYLREKETCRGKGGAHLRRFGPERQHWSENVAHIVCAQIMQRLEHIVVHGRAALQGWIHYTLPGRCGLGSSDDFVPMHCHPHRLILGDFT